jgi:hypothetical protein
LKRVVPHCDTGVVGPHELEEAGFIANVDDTEELVGGAGFEADLAVGGLEVVEF